MARTAAVVVLYHPGEEVVANIRTWNDQVAKVYAVDNSEPPDESLAVRLVALGNVICLPQRANLGIAAALNIGAESAIAEGFDYLLTMDQDSRAQPGMVETMLGCLKKTGSNTIGIIAPFASVRSEMAPQQGGISEELMVITSGNLLNLNSYKEIGRFDEKLFIDMVDIDYCLRLRIAGHKVIRCNDTLLYHELGNITAHTYRGRTNYVINHNSLRRYYMSRNRWYVINKYQAHFPEYCRSLKTAHRGEIKAIILFENDKLKKLWMTLKGYLDFRRGRFGRYGTNPESRQRSR